MIEDSAGSLMVVYGGSNVMKIGVITSASATVSKNVSVTPIPSKRAENAFPVEKGNTLSYSFNFTRIHPADYDDTAEDMDKWSNAKWYATIVNLVNRWQMKTDGCVLWYNCRNTVDNTTIRDGVPSENGVYLPVNPNTISVANKRAYVREFSIKYTSDFNTVLTGTVSFIVGRMHISAAGSKQPRPTLDYIYAVQKPGSLGGFPLLKISNNSNDTVVSLFGMENNSVEVIPEERTTVGLKTNEGIELVIPYPPSHWVTYARLARKVFLRWEIKLSVSSTPDRTYPGKTQELNSNEWWNTLRDNDITLTAVWGDE